MYFNFEVILFYLVIISGVVGLIDIIFLAPRRRSHKMPWYADYARSFFPILLLVFLMRSFLYEPFRIPSGSLEPTLLVGDFILVNKYYYGLRLPIAHELIYKNHEPLRGDILIFRWPPSPSFDFIKRVIGLPGDHISYINKVLFINNHEIPQTFNQNITDTEDGMTFNVVQKEEDLLGVKHQIFQIIDRLSYDFKDIVVPNNMYFVMGDNRDNSMDSRYWGFVADKNIVGKGDYIWMSWDSENKEIRWDRLFKRIH